MKSKINKIELEKEKMKLQQEQNKNFNKLVDKGLPLLEKYFTSKIEKLEVPKFKWTLIVFALVLLVSVGMTGVLTFFGKVGAENFTFLLGILIGAIITLMGDILLNMGGNN